MRQCSPLSFCFFIFVCFGFYAHISIDFKCCEFKSVTENRKKSKQNNRAVTFDREFAFCLQFAERLQHLLLIVCRRSDIEGIRLLFHMLQIFFFIIFNCNVCIWFLFTVLIHTFLIENRHQLYWNISHSPLYNTMPTRKINMICIRNKLCNRWIERLFHNKNFFFAFGNEMKEQFFRIFFLFEYKSFLRLQNNRYLHKMIVMFAN